MSVELQHRGYRVTGVDASPAMLTRARARLSDDVALVECTLPDLPLASTFDAVVSTMDGLNYLPPTDLAATFAAFAARLRPRGWLVFDLHGPAAPDFVRANGLLEFAEPGHRIVLSTDLDEAGVVHSTITLTASVAEDSFTETHVQYLHSEEAVRTALHSAGFTVETVLDEYSERESTPETLRATWVARLEAQ